LIDNVIKEFCHRHGLKVLDSNKRAYKFTKMNVNWFQYQTDYNRIDSIATDFETETLYTIEISESELERIAHFENEVFNNMTKKGHFNMFEMLMEQKENEKYLRDRYPAVRKAYEQYSLMLSLANSGKSDLPNA
jgi:hypothetical protein